MFTKFEKELLKSLVVAITTPENFYQEFVKTFNSQTVVMNGVSHKGNLTEDQLEQTIISILNKVDKLPLIGQLN